MVVVGFVTFPFLLNMFPPTVRQVQCVSDFLS